MQLRARRQGIAMLYALLLLVVVMGVATLMFARTLGEIKQSGDDAGIVQSLMLARGAANLGGSILQQKVRDDLQAIVQQQSSTTNPWSFGTGPINSPYPTPVSVRGALSIGSGSVAGALQPKIDGLLCGNAITPRQGGHAALRIYVTDTACDEPLPSGITLPAGHFVSGQARNGSGTAAEQTYALPFVLIADGYAGSYHRNVVIQGEYDFKVGRSSFAKYALFTNVHELPQNGGNVWFTDHTLFDGPVQKDASGNWTPAATYQYIQACTGDHGNACTTYRYGSDDVLYQLQSNGSWKQSDAAFNGVVYANGNVDRLTGPARTPPGSGEPADAPPALASFAQVTVASQGSTQITGDLTYEGQPCQGELHRDSNGQAVPPTCDNLNAANVLGVYAQGGDVLIGNADYRGSSYDAPQDVKIDGVLMSASGTVSVENFRYGSPRGSVHLLGGIIEYNYGAFGTFSASSGLDTSGYSRKFTYDQRMAKGLAPPHFPTVGGDGVKDVALYTYGQREQVY
ncbi:MAG: DUF4900 domain-containing protein [Deinococcales bacterium]